MESVKTLIQCVARAFYDTKHIIVLDALLRHSTIRDDDFAHLMSIQRKELHKLCGKLKDDCMLETHTRSEMKEGYQRPLQTLWYYINTRQTVDAVKWRMHYLGKVIEKRLRNDYDSKGYVCHSCTRQYTMLEAVTLWHQEIQAFKCEVCDGELVDDNQSIEVKDSQERLARLNSQLEKIILALKAVDNVVVPENSFTIAFANIRPTTVHSSFTSSYQNLPADAELKIAESQTIVQAKVEIDFLSENQLGTKSEAQAEQAAENALPVWHMESTIGKDHTSQNGITHKLVGKENDTIGASSEPNSKQKNVSDVDAIAAFFEALKRKEAEERALDAAAVNEDGDSDGEDVEESRSANLYIPDKIEYLSNRFEIDGGAKKRKPGTTAEDLNQDSHKKANVEILSSGEEDSEAFEDV